MLPITESYDRSIELQELKGPPAPPSAFEVWQEKSRRKYRQLLEREAMKFSHGVQFNAVPEWSSHYINYSNLKKLYVILPSTCSLT